VVSINGLPLYALFTLVASFSLHSANSIFFTQNQYRPQHYPASNFFSHKKSAPVISTTSQANTVFIFAFCLEAAQIRNTDALKLFAMTKL